MFLNLWLYLPPSLYDLMCVSVKTPLLRMFPFKPAQNVAASGFITSPRPGIRRTLMSCPDVSVLCKDGCFVCLHSLWIAWHWLVYSPTWFSFFHHGLVLCLGGRKHPPDCPVLGKGVLCISLGTISLLALCGEITLHRIKSGIIHVPILLELLF